MGVIFEAEHLDLGRHVALKVLRANLANNEVTVARFLREGQATARIRHPHVVEVIDVGTVLGVPYLVMELLEGETLAAVIARGPMPLDEVIAVLLPVCAAVATVHAHGVLHRDLKPDNILLERTPHGPLCPKVLDFGIARCFDDDVNLALTSSSAILGTPYYLSPEQARGARDLDPRSDQYALGVILYECSTGRRPFLADSLLAVISKITAGEVRSPCVLCPELPEAFGAVVLRAMAHEPDARFPSAWALGAALLPFANFRTQQPWEEAFEFPEDHPPVPRRPAPVRLRGTADLAETMSDPHPPSDPRVQMDTPALPLRRRRWWPYATAVAALLGAFLARSALTTPSTARRPTAPATPPAPPPLPVAEPAEAVATTDVPTTDGDLDRPTLTQPAAPVRTRLLPPNHIVLR